MSPRFFYFDLGKVLVNFDVNRMLGQMADVSGATVDTLKKVIFDDGLQLRYEAGEIGDEEFFETFCQQTGTRPDRDALRHAASDIFELNYSMAAMVGQLRAAGYPLGILSNTCHAHWEHCRRHYRIIEGLFDIAALSFEIRAIKPDAAIFRAAANLAGHKPEEIFFVDDTLGHVEGARTAGWDAVQYQTTPQLATELRRRGARFNYG